jgi:small subunit ribosomal protein S14
MKNGIQLDKRKRELYKKYELKRLICKILLLNKNLPNELKKKRFQELSKLSRNSSITRIRNYCVLTGRTKGTLQKFKLSRISFRELASEGSLMGVFKSSW